MSIRPLATSNSLGSNFNAVNDLMRDVQRDQQLRVIKDEQGTRVVVLDKNGLRTTTPGGGVDVMSAEDDELTFNSARNTLKVVSSGDVELPAQAVGTNDGKAGTRQIAHGRSSVPVVIAYGRVNHTIATEGDGTTASTQNVYAYAPLPYKPINSLFDTNVSAYDVTCLVDETYIYISYLYETNGLGGYNFPAVPVKYYVLEESAT